MADSMVGTVVASFVMMSIATGTLMSSSVAVSFDQGADQRKVSASAVSEAVATAKKSPVPEEGLTVTRDGVDVRLWSTRKNDQTVYHGRPLDCTGPGCREYSVQIPSATVGTMNGGAEQTPYQVTHREDRMEFTLPPGKDRFYFAMEGVEGKDRVSWTGIEQGVSMSTAKKFSASSEQCAVEDCAAVDGEAVFGMVDIGGSATRPMTFTIHLWNPVEGPYTLPEGTNIVVYTLQ